MEILEHYKIYQRNYDNKLGIFDHSFWFLEMESDRFSLVKDLAECDVVPIFPSDVLENIPNYALDIIKDKIILVLGIFHTDDDTVLYDYLPIQSWKTFTKKFIVTETNLVNTNNKTINYDLLWNRQKLYFTEYNKLNLENRIWSTKASGKMFELGRIQKTISAKRFLSPTRVELSRQPSEDRKRQYFRQQLINVLKTTDNIFSDWSTVPPKILSPQEDIFDVSKEVANKSMWWPVSNNLYSETFISVYVETLVDSTLTRVITEKTFDPLIKGHFILPFGYCGIVKDIESYGFKLPDWIDYSYDKEPDKHKRFELFLLEFQRLQKINIKYFYEFFKKDYELLIHNRNVFFTRPYDTFYPSLIKALRHAQ